MPAADPPGNQDLVLTVRAGARREGAVLAAAFAVALAARVAYWALFQRHYVPISDADHYLGIATNLVGGRGFSHVYPSGSLHPTAFRLPVWPLLMAFAFLLAGTHLAVAMGLNVLIGSLVAPATAGLARRITGNRRAAAVAGLAVAVYPSLVAFSVTTLSEPSSLLLFVVVAWLVVARRYLAAGLAAGALVLVKDGAVLSLIALVAYALVRAGWRPAARLAGAAVLVVLPWLVRNDIQMHSPVLTTSNGFNVAAVYSDQTRQSGLYFVDPTIYPTFSQWWPEKADEVRWDSRLLSLGLDGLRSDPDRVAKVATHNLDILIGAPRVVANDDRIDGEPAGFTPDTRWLTWLVYGLGAVGYWRAGRSRRYRGVWVLPLAVAPPLVAAVASVTTPRLATPLDLAACAGLGLLVAAGRARPPGRQLYEAEIPTTGAASRYPEASPSEAVPNA